MKHIRGQDMTLQALDILASVTWPPHRQDSQEVLRVLLNYLFRAGNIKNEKGFIQQHSEQPPHSVRRELMTLAEQLEAKGMQKGMQKGIQAGIEEGMQKGQQNTAINLLKEGFDPALISRVTGLSVQAIEQLKN